MYSTTAQACIALRFNKARLNELARKGKIPRGPRPNQWDIDACRVALGRNLDIHQASPARGDMPKGSIGQKGQTVTSRSRETEGVQRGSLAHAQLLKTQAQAAEVGLKVRVMEGTLANVAEVNAYVAGCIIKARDTFLRIGPELRDRLAQETDPIRCDELVTSEIVRGLKEVSEYRPNVA